MVDGGKGMVGSRDLITTHYPQEVDLSLNTSLATSMATSSTSAPIDKKEENGGKMGKSNGYESPRNSRK